MTMFIVIYADNDQLTVPMQWDADCEGAIHCWMGGKEPVGRWQVDGVSHFPSDHWKLRDKKGGDIAEFPLDLQVREFPKAVLA